MRTFSVLLIFAFMGYGLQGCGKKELDSTVGPSPQNPDSPVVQQANLDLIQVAALHESHIANQLSVVLYAAVEGGQALRVWKPRLRKPLVCQAHPAQCRPSDLNAILEVRE